MNRLFRNILKENKNDYIRTVLGCSWIISLIYFSTAVGGCLSYISTGTIPQMTYLILEVEKEFLIPYGLLLFLLILLLSGYIRKRAAIYKTLTVFGMKRKHKYRFVLFEYLGIVGFSIILGIVLGICESKALKIILEYFFVNIKLEKIFFFLYHVWKHICIKALALIFCTPDRVCPVSIFLFLLPGHCTAGRFHRR